MVQNHYSDAGHYLVIFTEFEMHKTSQDIRMDSSKYSMGKQILVEKVAFTQQARWIAEDKWLEQIIIPKSCIDALSSIDKLKHELAVVFGRKNMQRFC